jgi:hypothetical protein
MAWVGLTVEQRRMVRRLSAEGLSLRQVAADYHALLHHAVDGCCTRTRTDARSPRALLGSLSAAARTAVSPTIIARARRPIVSQLRLSPRRPAG